MKTTIEPGLEMTRRVVVDETRVTRHLGEHLEVYATPAMINDVEMLCRDLLMEHLDPGEDSVGTRIDMQHLAATPEGMAVEIRARITGVDRRAVILDVVVRDAVDEVGRGTHHRFIADLAKVKERLGAKITAARGQ